MVYTKDGLSKEQFIKLLQYSLEPGCQFLTAVKPKTNIVNDHEFQKESVVRFLKVSEEVVGEIQGDGTTIYSYRFSVKVLVEDKYWKKASEEKNSYYKSEEVPAQVHQKVVKILSA